MNKCVIYTRKSTEHGLEQEFNSLHNQEAACKAYISSQAFNEWEYYKTFGDGGISGGTMKRPDLQVMLQEIEQGKINTVVVYKIDRLSRSILDFHKMMITFEKYGCNFVSVTQAFDTSTSMGKLTLNMLLSFAQFEREISSERVRDKIAASKRRGIWTGGYPKLGYDVVDKKLIVNEKEAEQIRFIFDTYLQVESINKLSEILKEKGIKTKPWVNSKEMEIKAKDIPKTNLTNMLKEKIYIGLIESKQEKLSWKGQHEAIIDKGVFKQVQESLAYKSNQDISKANTTHYTLKNILQTEQGQKFATDRSVKKGKSYRYYVYDKIRLSAGSVENVVSDLQQQISTNNKAKDLFSRISYFDKHLTFYVDKKNKNINMVLYERFSKANSYKISESLDGLYILIKVDLRKPSTHTLTKINKNLIQAVCTGWKYKKMIEEEGMTLSEIQHQEKVGSRRMYKLLNLAYLSPKIIGKVLDGNLGMKVEELCQIASNHRDWEEQENKLKKSLIRL